MELSKKELEIQKAAVNFVRKHKSFFIEKLVEEKKPLKLALRSYFMAGSPGAGKTEFSKRFIENISFDKIHGLKKDLEKMGIKNIDSLFIRIDVDEVRDLIPQFVKTNPKKSIKGNSSIIQKAANIGLEFIRDYCIENQIPFIHDGTFSNYSTMKQVIKKCLNKNVKIEIFYMYLDPISAWEFTKAREFLEGRNVIKEKFIDQFFQSAENVVRIKRELKDRLIVNAVIKDPNNENLKIFSNIRNLESILNTYYREGFIRRYTKKSLLKSIE